MSEKESRFDDEPSFSLNDFKKWMAKQTDAKPASASRRLHELVGSHVEPKLSLRRLAAQMTAEEGDLDELAKDFRKYGGVVRHVDRDQNVLIEVSSGTFTIPRFFVRER